MINKKQSLSQTYVQKNLQDANYSTHSIVYHAIHEQSFIM